MALDTALQTLKAAGDSTRIRLLTLLASGEATVGELQEILQQSQPRVSRHLRLLSEAGLVSRFRDGHWIYYRLAAKPDVVELVQQIANLAGPDDPTLSQDQAALNRVKRSRERDAFGLRRIGAGFGGGLIGNRAGESDLLDALDESLGDRTFDDALDIGSGGATLLRLLGRRARNVVGVDSSKSMRLLARSRVYQSGLVNFTVRDADLHVLPFADRSFGLVVLDEVLGSTDQVLKGLREAQRVLRPDGYLLIVDRIQPVARQLPGSSGNGVLFENQLTAMLSELGLKVSNRFWFPGRVMEYALFSVQPEATAIKTGTND